MSITDLLIDTIKAAAASPNPLPRCEHLSTKDGFRCYIQDMVRLCPACADAKLHQGARCDKCHTVQFLELPVLCNFSFVHSNSSVDTDVFTAILCKPCAGNTLPGEYGVRGEMFKADDGRTMFFPARLSVTPVPPVCVCPRFSDTGGYRIADLSCLVHGVDGLTPGDGPWEHEPWCWGGRDPVHYRCVCSTDRKTLRERHDAVQADRDLVP
jgi:hypothetical protein